MKRVINGGTIWGDQFARIVQEYVSDPILFEIGAFNGEDIKLFLEVLPQTKAFAFEASPLTYKEYLLDKPYPTFNVAVGNKNGNTVFYESGERPTSSIYYRKLGEWKKAIVPIVKLKDFIKQEDLPHPNVVKIDTEGATYDVLKGMGKLLNEVKVLYLETEDIEYWEGQKLHKDVEELLEGFTCLLLHDNNHQFDSIWVNSH